MRHFIIILIFTVFSLQCAQSDAWIFKRRGRSTQPAPHADHINQSYQSVAQAKANAMAAQCRLSHNINGIPMVGSFEGIGCGSSPHCTTCTPRSRMTLVADASAKGRNGLWYRCRGWR